MNRQQAAAVLGLSADARPGEIEAAYRAIYSDLEQRVLQAPVEGLKQKYRTELRRAQQAHQVLQDSGERNPEDLPALRPVYAAQSSPSPPATGTVAAQDPRRSVPPRGGVIGKYIVMTIILLLAAGGFVFATQAGPLQNWWREVSRDKTLLAEIAGLEQEVESLESNWAELRAEIGGEAPEEVDRALHLAKQGQNHLSRLEDDLARKAYAAAGEEWESALSWGRERRDRQRTESLDRARAEGEKAKVLFGKLERAQEWNERDLREAKSHLRSVEGRSGADAGDLSRAEAECAHLERYAELSRKLVLEGKGYAKVRGLLVQGEARLQSAAGEESLSLFRDAATQIAAMLETLPELKELLLAERDAKRELAQVRASAPAPYRPAFQEASRILEAAASSLREGNLEAARKSLELARQSWTLGQERVAGYVESMSLAQRSFSSSAFTEAVDAYTEAERLARLAGLPTGAAVDGRQRAAKSAAEVARRAIAAEYDQAMSRAKGLYSTGDFSEAERAYQAAGSLAERAGLSCAAASAGRTQAVAEMKRKEALLQRFEEKLGDPSALHELGDAFHHGREVMRDYGEAMMWYRRAAEHGVAASMRNIGLFHDHGLGVNLDYNQAAKWYRSAAEKGDAVAMRNLGILCYSGRGMNRDQDGALNWFRKAMEQGDGTAIGAILYYRPGAKQDDGEAMKQLREAADSNDAKAMNFIGIFFAKGLGVRQDCGEAMKWYRLAAEAGMPAAMRNIGHLYLEGNGVKQDSTEALIWFRKAVDKGDPRAMLVIGSLYANGECVAQDYGAAMKWFTKAAQLESPPAMIEIANLHFWGRGVEQDFGEAMKWYQRAADKGSALAMANIAILHANGQGVKRDYMEAMKWYRQAAELNHAPSMDSIGTFYEHGQGVRQDYAEAMKWYRKAAERNNAGAMQNIGSLYHHGQGVRQDYAEALRWYRRAAAGGDASAMNNMGTLYENGHGVEKDLAEAMNWYRAAAKKGNAHASQNLQRLGRD